MRYLVEVTIRYETEADTPEAAAENARAANTLGPDSPPVSVLVWDRRRQSLLINKTFKGHDS